MVLFMRPAHFDVERMRYRERGRIKRSDRRESRCPPYVVADGDSDEYTYAKGSAQVLAYRSGRFRPFGNRSFFEAHIGGESSREARLWP